MKESVLVYKLCMIRIQSVWYVFKVYDNVFKSVVKEYVRIQSVWYVFKVYDNVL